MTEAPKKVKMIYGIRSVLEALDSDTEIDVVFIQRDLTTDLIRELKSKLRLYKKVYKEVPREKFEQFNHKNHQGVIALLTPIKYHLIENILPPIFEKGEVPFLLILDGITDVRNFGAIARTAECSGVHAVVIANHGSAQINNDAIKTSSGALYKIKVCREHHLKESIKFIKECGVQIVACIEKADKSIFDIDFTIPTAFIIGSEEKGISSEFIKLADCSGRIPLEGSIESLNVSVSAGVVLYETLRQRKLHNSRNA